MKSIFKILGLTALVAFAFSSCDKVDDLPFYNDGTSPVLTASNANIAPAVSDSTKEVVSFSWTSANHSVSDSSAVKYILQIDSAGRDFTKPFFTKTLTAKQSFSLTGKEITQMLIDRGLQYNKAYDMDVRVISSFANNNEQLMSNKVAVKMTAYVTPPKVTLPFTKALFIVGAATQGGWNNPVPAPMQAFARIDSTTYVGVFEFNANEEFLLLPQNGSWDNKYSLADNGVSGINEGGDFGYNLDKNFKGPSKAGWYKVTMDFQRGKFTIKPYVGAQIPEKLFIVGDATPGGWNNPVPAATQQFTRLNSVQFQIATLALNGGNQYLLLPVNGSWDNKYNPEASLNPTGTGGFFGYNRGGDNFPAPATSGNYMLEVNFGVQQMTSGAEVLNSAWYKNTKL